MQPLKCVRVEYLPMLKRCRTAEVEAYFMFRFYFFSTHKTTPKQAAVIVLSALKTMFHSVSSTKRGAYSSNVSEEDRIVSYTTTTFCTQMML